MTSQVVPTGQTGRQETLSEWAGPYVTDMLGKAKAISEAPYQTYKGPLTAGESELQKQAFQGIGSLKAPGSFTAGTFTNTFSAPQSYQPTQFTPGFTYQAPTTATQFTNQFKAPEAFKAGTFEAGKFGSEQAQQYMNPYLQAALAPALDEMRRQAEISRVGQAGRLTQAGAYGGGRQAIMESELTRNMLDAQRRALGEGYATAYDKATAQYNADQARAMEAQRLGEQSRQFGASQGMTAAQLQAQFGLSAQQAQEAARQFNAGQALTAAQLRSQFDLDAQRAAEMSRQFGAQQAMQGAQLGAQYGLEAQRLGEQSKQFGAQYGLSALESQRQNLAQQLAAGAQQRDIAQQGIAADLAEFQAQRDYPFKMLQFQQSMLQGLPIQSIAAQYQQPSSLQSTINTMGGLMDLYQKFFPQTGKKP